MIFKNNGRLVVLMSILTCSFAFFSSSLWGKNLAGNPTVVKSLTTQDIDTKDIILSANGAAGRNDWEYNANYGGQVRHSIIWEPKGTVTKVQWRCVDNCQDERKFDYRVQLKNGQLILIMKATSKEQGLIRVQLTALVE